MPFALVVLHIACDRIGPTGAPAVLMVAELPVPLICPAEAL